MHHHYYIYPVLEEIKTKQNTNNKLTSKQYNPFLGVIPGHERHVSAGQGVPGSSREEGVRARRLDHRDEGQRHRAVQVGGRPGRPGQACPGLDEQLAWSRSEVA